MCDIAIHFQEIYMITLVMFMERQKNQNAICVTKHFVIIGH